MKGALTSWYAQQVRVWQHANPPEAAGFVIAITMYDADGKAHVVWKGDDRTACGGVLQVEGIEVATPFLTRKVELTTQTACGNAWEYVDAVQLVGFIHPC